MILRISIVIVLLVAASAYYDDAEAEETKPITGAKFERKYYAYLNKLKECDEKKDENRRNACKQNAHNSFRTITHRGVHCEIIGEIWCKKGEFGKFEMVQDGNTMEVELPC